MRRLWLDPRLWAMLDGLAERQYGGCLADTIAGLIIHSEMVRNHKESRGLKEDHWLTRPIVQHADELESVLKAWAEKRLESVGEYVSVRVDERAKAIVAQPQNQPPSGTDSQRTVGDSTQSRVA